MEKTTKTNEEVREEEKEEVREEEKEEVKSKETPKLEKKDFLSMIASLLSNEQIDQRQATQMRQEFGVFGSYFTKKRDTSKVRKQKRKSQARARRITLRHGLKGQKVNHVRRRVA